MRSLTLRPDHPGASGHLNVMILLAISLAGVAVALGLVVTTLVGRRGCRATRVAGVLTATVAIAELPAAIRRPSTAVLLLSFVTLALVLAATLGSSVDNSGGDSGGEEGGGDGGSRRGDRPPRPEGPVDRPDPEWWPEFERDFADYVARRGSPADRR